MPGNRVDKAGRVIRLLRLTTVTLFQERLSYAVFWTLVGAVLVTVVYAAALVADGGLFTRASASSNRIPALLGRSREPAFLGPAHLHPVPSFRLPNYQPPRHAS